MTQRLVPRRSVLEPREPTQLDLWEREARYATHLDQSWLRDRERREQDQYERLHGGRWQEAPDSGLAEEVIRDERFCDPRGGEIREKCIEWAVKGATMGGDDGGDGSRGERRF